MLQVLSKMEGQTCWNYHPQNPAIPCSLTGSIFQMSQVPCKMRGSISTTQVDVAKCWTYCTYHVNYFFVFLLFWPWCFCQFFPSWALQSFNWGLLDFMALLVFTATNTSIGKSQTLPTPKQWPHHTTNRQQPTTNNVLQIACQTQDSSSKMLLIASNMEDSSSKMLRSSSKMLQIACQWGCTELLKKNLRIYSMPNEIFQFQNVANICKYHAKWKF